MTRRWNLWVLLVACLALAGGCQSNMQCAKEWQSQTVGINRTTSVYSYDGKLIGQWNSKTVIDADSGGLTTFFDSTQTNRILVNGGILISVEHP